MLQNWYKNVRNSKDSISP